MSLPSYEISKIGGVWWATGHLDSGRSFKIECGKGSKEAARGFADSALARKLRSAEGSRKRWEAWREAKARGETLGTRRLGRPPKNAPPSNEPYQPVSPSQPPAPPPPSATDEEMRAKLLGLGDAQPIAPDDVIPPGPGGGAAEEDPPMDDEGGELIASLIAKAATVGLVAFVNARLKKRKPPQHAEPHEKGLEWYHDGMEFHLRRLLGKTATLGPTGKIFAGAAIIVGSMYMNAEPIDPPPPAQQQSSSAPPAPPEPPPAPPEQTNGHTPPPRPPVTALALGHFGVEKRSAN